MTRVYIPITVNDRHRIMIGFVHGYYLRQPGDDRNGPLIVEPGERAYPNPKEIGMKCEDCKWWSEMIAGTNDQLVIEALCLNVNSVKYNQMVSRGCDEKELGPAVDCPANTR